VTNITAQLMTEHSGFKIQNHNKTLKYLLRSSSNPQSTGRRPARLASFRSAYFIYIYVEGKIYNLKHSE